MAKGGKRAGAGRPSGKISASAAAIRSLARDFAPEALLVVTECMRDENQSAGIRLQAANIILERSYGRPRTEEQAIDTDPDILNQLAEGAISAKDAAIKLVVAGFDVPAVVNMMLQAELRLVEPPEEDINPAPPKEAAITMQQYAEFVEWQKAQAQARSAALIAKIAAEDAGFNGTMRDKAG